MLGSTTAGKHLRMNMKILISYLASDEYIDTVSYYKTNESHLKISVANR